MKKILELVLKYLAKVILDKYQPDVIGITGSVGKTSAKEAIYSILVARYNVRKNEKNYNNEIGLPLTIIGQESPGRSLFGWAMVIIKAWKLIVINDKKYPKILVLEMGVDRPGDMGYLLSFLPCRLGVITAIGQSHLEFFGSVANIRKEKGLLIEHLPKNGWAILNFDNQETRKLPSATQASVLTYGLNDGAKVRAEGVHFSFNREQPSSYPLSTGNLNGVSFKLIYQGSFVPILLPKVIGLNAVYAALAGAAIGIAYGLNLVEIAQALKHFDSPPGRMNLVSGIKDTLIIDDTYNSSPQSSLAALAMVKLIPLVPGARRLAILGDMLELGAYSEPGHFAVGQAAAKSNLDELIVVGERARDIARGAIEAGFQREQIFHFSDSDAAGKFVEKRLSHGDLILIKGSQGMRMEKVVLEIMAEPGLATKLLVRQGKEWGRATCNA
jgi:UDP-N-acetylmuramoyl-tripeptide--D-alanyl-D-alanine ligase